MIVRVQKVAFKSSTTNRRPLNNDTDNLEATDMEEINLKKRWRGTRKKTKPSKKKRRQEEPGEEFDLDVDGDEDEVSEREGIMSHQLGYYKGEDKIIVKRAIVYVQIFLLCMNGYPEKDQLTKWASKAFEAACQVSYGPNYEGAYEPDSPVN